jgi:hypothetical protein
MQRIARKAPGTLRVTVIGPDGAAADADANPTVTVVRDSDGSTLAHGAIVKPADTTGIYTTTVTCPEADLLTATWAAEIDGDDVELEVQTEVVGGFLCSLEDAEASLDSSRTTEQLTEARRWAEEILEQACNVAFRPRYARETFDGDGSTDLLVPDPGLIEVLTAEIAGVAVTDFVVDPSGLIYREAGWRCGRRNIELTYLHGFSTPPEDVRRAAVRLARHYLVPDPTDYDERSSSLSTEFGTYVFTTPGVRGAETSLPEVNAVIQRYRYPQVG